MLLRMAAAPLGLLLIGGLFVMLANLVGIGKQVNHHATDIAPVYFLKVTPPTEVALRKRELPPEPEVSLAQPPSMPKPQQQNVVVETPEVSIDVPNIDAQVALNFTPDLTNITVAVPTPQPTTQTPVTSAPQTEVYLDTNPTVLSQTPPRYPSRALRKKLEGSVTVEFTVMTSGKVEPGSIKVISATPPGVFDSAVIRSLKRWRFKTHSVAGTPTAYRARQTLQFNLGK
ncbi:MAG: TonB family protein [Pontibacterium sp.]